MHHYPDPKIPIKPILSRLPTRNLSKKDEYPSILNANHRSILVTSGRAAIALSLTCLNISKGDKVLLPAYHCSSMVEPVVWLEATPVFFKVHSDCSVNISDIENKIDKDTKAIIVTHYFGFPQDMPKIKILCEKYNIKIIEDCAHAFFGSFQNKPLGSFGDFAIASAMKFFPVYDGGCLSISNNVKCEPEIVSAGIPFELKALFNTFEYAFEYGRLPILKFSLGILFKLKDFVWNLAKSTTKNSENLAIGPSSADGGYLFEASWNNKSISKNSKIILRGSSFSEIIKKRRENYLTLRNSLNQIRGCQSLFDDLPDNVVPYVCPILFDNPEKLFPILKNQGVPIVRFGEYLWDGVDSSICADSVALSKKVFQFPCHQNLTSKEIDWMITTIRNSLTDNNK